MVYFLNTNINENKRVSISLNKIFGLGSYRTQLICREFGITKKTRFKNLTKKLKNNIQNFIEQNYLIGQDLKRKIINFRKEKLRIKYYNSIRIRQKLPSRGQRTHTNAKTIKKHKI